MNEDNNDAIITSAPLSDLGPNAQGQEVWGNPSGLAVAMNKTNASTANIGVVIALSGNKNDTTCGHPYVQCFDQTPRPVRACCISKAGLLQGRRA